MSIPKTRHVFGIVSFSEVEHVPQGGTVQTALIEYGRTHGLTTAKTFALRIKRVGKHDFSSNDKAIKLGDFVRKAFPHLKVNLAAPMQISTWRSDRTSAISTIP